MNTRTAAPVLGTVSLVALLVGGAGAAQARVMIDDGPRTVASQGVSFDRAEAIRAAKQAEAGTTTGISPAEAQGARLQKLAEEQADAAERLRQHQLEHGASSDRVR